MQSNRLLESVEKSAMKIICYRYRSYEDSLDELQIQKLSLRRREITRKFAINMSKNPKFTHLFPINNGPETRNRTKFIEPQCKLKRYFTSPIPHFIRIINNEKL